MRGGPRMDFCRPRNGSVGGLVYPLAGSMARKCLPSMAGSGQGPEKNQNILGNRQT